MLNYIGIDIGGTAVKAGIVSEDGNIICKIKVEAFFDNYKTPLLVSTLKAVKQIYEISQNKKIVVSGVGISCTGDVDVNKKLIVGGCGSIPLWENIDLKAEMKNVVPLNIELINDANAAALGEMWLGNGKNFKNLIVYTIGTGIGGGIVIDGKILSGSKGYGGNIGHMVVKAGAETCACGNQGCFEAIASTRALMKKARECGFHGGGEALFLAAKTNERLKKILDDFYEIHGIALSSLIHIFNPEAIIIGGGISNQGNDFVNEIKNRTKSHTLPHFFQGVEILQAKLTNDAGLIGSVKNYIDLNNGNNN